MKLSLATMAACACAAGASAQTDVLYMPDSQGGSGKIRMIQGGAVTGSFNMVGSIQEGPIAVYGDVRTVGVGGFGSGAKYSLSGTYLGTTYPQPGLGTMYDGTTDGTSNYAFVYPGSKLYKFDRNWANPTVLFDSGITWQLGITYDSKNNTIWTIDRIDGLTRQFTMGGTLVSQFQSPLLDGLAYETSTDTLWYNEVASNRLIQYSKSGVLLNTVFVSGLSGAESWHEIEFDIPAPGSFALLALGGLGVARRRRA